MLQYSQPEFFLPQEEMYPPVKRRDGDFIPAAYLLHRAAADKVSAQDNDQEAQGIRPVWNNAGREQRMGMPTGIADVPGYGKNARCLSMAIPFHEISFIVSESTQAAFGGTVRTLLAGLRSRLKGRFKPLLIRKFHIIQLAKTENRRIISMQGRSRFSVTELICGEEAGLWRDGASSFLVTKSS